MDLAKTREATGNDMKSLALQGASAGQTNIDAVSQNSNPQCGKCGLHDGKKCPAYGTRCIKCRHYNHWKQVCRNKQFHDKQSRPPSQQQFEGRRSQDKARQSKVHSIDEAGSDFEELLLMHQ